MTQSQWPRHACTGRQDADLHEKKYDAETNALPSARRLLWCRSLANIQLLVLPTHNPIMWIEVYYKIVANNLL